MPVITQGGPKWTVPGISSYFLVPSVIVLKSWEFSSYWICCQNTGTCHWQPGYKISCLDDFNRLHSLWHAHSHTPHSHQQLRSEKLSDSADWSWAMWRLAFPFSILSPFFHERWNYLWTFASSSHCPNLIFWDGLILHLSFSFSIVSCLCWLVLWCLTQ